jgi:polysaccharide pyruvyl transferase WcaK-like protein
MKKYECFYCLGADVMDGYYFPYATCKRVELVSLAAKSGANAAILGFSFNDKPDIECVRALKNLPQNVRLCARDPISHDRLIRHLDRTIELVADLAFLLPQNVSSPITNEISKWIYDERLNNRIIVGVNANYLPVGISDTMSISHQDIVDAYVKILVELSDQEQQFSFVLIPHDRRKNDGKCSDDDLASMIKNKLPAYLKQHCVKLPFPCSSVEIKSICNHIDLALTGRMHVAIACLGVGVPVLCITYQGKFEGLFQYFEIDERMLLEPQVLLEIEKINFLIREVVCNKEKIRKTINSKLLMIEKLSLKNFENY